MNAAEFIAKWRRAVLGERQAAQQHFLDLCELLRHPKPAEADPVGESFCFERGASKQGGGDGWADVWKKGFFGWEYKGRHKDLDAAYTQLLDYREDLDNPPLLVVCDLDRIVVHTNFTNTPHRRLEIPLDRLGEPRSLEILHAVFFDPDKLKPGVPSSAITEAAARQIGEVAQTLRGQGFAPEVVARFLDRLVFCMFAEDVGLLPEKLFSRLVEKSRREPARFSKLLGDLFAAMASGGDFGADEIRHFDGNLFVDVAVLPLTEAEIESVHKAALLDWGSVEPAIFGTLFERGLDPGKRAQIGAHYTSREDIETLVEPVVMQPLRREWEETKLLVGNLLATGKKHPGGGEKPPSGAALSKAQLEADLLLDRFLGRLGSLKVLDPACGSGNFLYVTLQKLLDLENDVSRFAGEHRISGFINRVHPWQLHGIEINRYAFELAQLTVWIGYLQWLIQHGYQVPDNPVLRPMDTFRCMDAILDLSDPDHPKEPEWPAVDCIVGNPPFLGDKLMRGGLSDEYVDRLRGLYAGRIPGQSDLCCYWFEKARRSIEERKCHRAGLLATQGVRRGANRTVLERIKATGDIFFAVSDREWQLDGAIVHVSLIGFDDASEEQRSLDGGVVPRIECGLTRPAAGEGAPRRLVENSRLAFIGTMKKGPFELDEATALSFLHSPNPNGRPGSDVVRPWVNGLDVTGRPRRLWIVDFPFQMPIEAAAAYAAPFERIRTLVAPLRIDHREAVQRKYWWRMARPSPELREAVSGFGRYLVTPAVSKHRVFCWEPSVVVPDQQVIAVAREDWYVAGALQSRSHEVWVRRFGNQLRERESALRYNVGPCFETFPFPWPPGHEPGTADDLGQPGAGPQTPDLGSQSPAASLIRAIADAARELNDLRERWLNPPEWTREEVLEFPGSADGPWGGYVHDPDARGVGTVRYPRMVPKDADAAAKLKARTLTNLYNQRPAWLALAHEKLDAAVFAAYAWDPTMSDDDLLASLLALNLARASTEGPDGGSACKNAERATGG